MKKLILLVVVILSTGCVSQIPSMASTAELCHMYIYREPAFGGYEGIEAELDKRGVKHMCADLAKTSTSNGLFIRSKGAEVIYVKED